MPTTRREFIRRSLAGLVLAPALPASGPAPALVAPEPVAWVTVPHLMTDARIEWLAISAYRDCGPWPARA